MSVHILFLGINIFLDGFVPTENLRFRETSLIFKVSETATEEEIKRLCCYDYPKMNKQLGRSTNSSVLSLTFAQFHDVMFYFDYSTVWLYDVKHDKVLLAL